MRKMKIIMMSAAVVLAVGAAMATKAKTPCDSQPQYYKVGNNYYPAGEYGIDYVCEWDHFGTCTYYYDAGSKTYQPCKAGKILWLR